ncbi:signal peptidase complex subunit 1-like [Panonychus citri]|uniref:signal peptidase complex subunit 1-like n=1 Tax=Panonychus citri TaxID=50023 RepID=UPI002307D0BC|nr:signal peptidase complex subunit 1-like [Panonychus citri]
MSGFLESIPTHMDFAGQKKAEKLFQTLILTAAVIGLGIGYYHEQFSYTVYSLGAGFVISCLLTLPPWPMYRKHPVKWQKRRKETSKANKEDEPTSSPSSPSATKGKKKK